MNYKFISLFTICFIVFGVCPVNAQIWMINPDGSNFAADFNDTQYPNTLHLQGSFNAGGTQYSVKGETTIDAYPSTLALTINNFRFSIDAATKLTLNGFTINGVNAPGNGGVVWMPSAATASFNSMIFDSNIAQGNGGVAAISNDSGILNIAGSTFKNTSNNTNAARGGAVYLSGGTSTLTGTNSFTGLKVSDAGGAIGVGKGTLTVGGNATFQSNSSVWGGALYADAGSGTSTINLNASAGTITLDSNTSVHGGGIYMSNGGITNLNATGGGIINITNNKATASGDQNAGGGITAENSNVSIKSDGAGSAINFTGNSSPSMRGGAMYLVSNSGAYTTNITASNGGAIKFDNNSDAGWSNQYGSGAIGALGNFLNITADNGNIVFSNNKTTASGTLASGAIFVDAWRNGATNSNPTLTLKTTTASSSIVFTNNTISGGTASRDIAIYGGNMLVTGDAGYVYSGGGISGTGNGISLTKSGNNTFILAGDNSGYDPLFTQTGGAVKFTTASTMFSTGITNMQISGGEQQIVLGDASVANIAKAKGTFSSNGALAYLASTTNAITATFSTAANTVFSDSTDVIFGADYNMSTGVKVAANYILNADSDFSKTNLGRVIFRDSTLKLNNTNYANNYGLSNTVLDLRNSANATTTFSNLTSANNSSLALDAGFMVSGGTVSLSSDKLVVNSTTAGSNTIALGNVSMSSMSLDNGMNLGYSATVLTGLTFTAPTVTQYVNSPIYRYQFGMNGVNLTMNAVGFADGNSLDAANKLTGTRKFDFASYGTSASQTYATSANLSNAGTGAFSVLGRSGYNDVINANGHTLFNLTDATTLTLKDITLSGASGADIKLANANASLILGGVTTISDGISGVAGGTIYKDGTLNLGGDNSGFNGSFTQNTGVTNVSGKFFNGTSNITGGTLNLNAGSSISSNTILAIANGATLNLSTANDMALASNQIKNYAGAGGAVNKSGTGAMNINGDNSGFNGTFTQTGGTTTVGANGKMFAGTNNINGGTLNVTGDSIYYKANVGTSGVLNHFATTSANNNILSGAVGMNGGTVNFHDGNYILGTALPGSGTMNFVNGTLDLDSSDYTGSIAYGLDNSVLKLDNNVSFTTLNVSNNSSIALNVSFATGNTITTNTLTTANTGQTIGLSSVKLLNDNLYDGLNKTFTYQTLHGLTWATNNPTFAIATSTWQYEASVSGSNLNLSVVGASNNMTLDTMNKMAGARGFNFSNVGAETYAVGGNLSPMATGNFIVQGNGSTNVLDAAGYSLFNMSNATEFTLQNLSVKNANGGVLTMNNANAVANITNTQIQNNSSANGGAINVANGHLTISDSGLSNNTATGKGGAIYIGNLGNVSVINTSFSNNGTTDIYNDGALIIGGTGTTTITAGIAGAGNITKSDTGVLQLGGDNSAFTGIFEQTNGNTVFNGKFFAGQSNIDGGILEWKDNGSLSSTSAIQIAEGGQLLVSSNNEITVSGGQLAGAGDISKTGTGIMTVTGDNSGFTGTYSQIAGTTTVGASDKLFSGKNIIENSILNVTSDNIYYNAQIMNGGHLVQTATGTNQINIANNVDFIGNGNSMLFTGTNALYSLAGKIDNGSANNITFQNSTLKLGANDFTGGTKYALNNSILDLRNAALENATFTNLNITNGAKLSLNLDLATNTNDILTISNSGQTINLGQIALMSDGDDGSHIGYTFDVLSGLTFGGLSDTLTLTTSAYKYRVETSGTQIILTATGADSDTLYKQNALSGARSFDFHIYNNSGEYTADDIVTYHNTQALGTTSIGVFNVIGRSSDATKTAIDGALADGTYGTLFKLANNTTLNISDLTLQNVITPSTDGPVLNSSNAVAIANLSNVIVSGNSGNNGGAIYNKSATLNITGGTFTNNTATTAGGAIYNAGALNLAADSGKSITFANNTANGASNDIYNSTTLNITGAGTVNIGGGISGTGMTAMKGAGILNLGGDNSSYTGTFRQNSGTTNVSGKFFTGNSDIFGGTLNFNNGAILSTGDINISAGAIANINADSFAVNGQFAGKGTIDKTSNGVMNLTGDNSKFDGVFTQTGGTTISGGTLFDTAMNILGGTLTLEDNTKLSFDTKFNIANGATLDIANTTDWDMNIDSSHLTASGNVNKTGNGILDLSGDFSSNTGKFTQTSGTTILADDTKLFGNSASQNVISGGVLQVHIDTNDEFNQPVTLDGGTLQYLSDSTNILNVNNAALSQIVVSNPNTEIVFDTASSTLPAKYNLGENLNVGGASIAFDNSYITLGADNFTGGTTYSFNNSTLDLSSDVVANTTAPVQNVVFDNLLVNNSWLDLDVNFQLDTTQPDTLPTIVTADKITNNGAAGQINLGVIKFHNGNADDGKTDIYTIKVLDGNLTFKNAQDIHYASGAYMYEVTTEIGGQTINLDGMGPAGAHSLYTINAQSGERIFSLDEYPDANYVYHIDSSLSQTAVGQITLIGNNAGTQTISGAIVDSNGNLTGAKGSLFAIGNDASATLVAQNITFADAAGANGALLSQDNVDAVSSFQNTTVKNNTATANGGAIYNNAGTVNIVDQGTISGNTAGANGGAIYNNATLNFVASSGHDITLANNTANGVGNDIYNTGIMNISGAGNVNINSGIAGTSAGSINMAGEGVFNVNADSSLYTGKFSQYNGTTNAGANFFTGENDIHGGILNFTGTGSQTGGTLNIAGGLVNVHDTASIKNTNVSIDSGRLLLTDNATTNGANITVSGGALAVDSNATVNNGTIALNGGVAVVAGKLSADTTTVTDGVLEMQSGGILSGGNLTLNGGGVAWSGTKQSTATLTANGGTLIVAKNSTLDLNNTNDKINAATQFHVEANATLHNTAGNITVGRDDLISGTLQNGATVSFNGGAYDYTNTSGGAFVQTSNGATTNIIGGAQMMLGAKSTLTGGTINIGGDGVKNSLLGVGANATFAKEIQLNVNADNNFVVNGGTATVDGADALNGTIDLLGGDLYFDNATLNGALVASNGTLHIQNGTLDVGTGSSIAKEVNIMLSASATMNINNGSEIEINNNDSILGKVGLNSGKMIFNGLTKTDDFELDITGGTLALENGANWTAHANDSSTNTTNIEITDSTMNILAGSGFNTFASVYMKNGTINMINDASETYNFGVLKLDGDSANFAMDIDGANLTHDIFTIDSISGVGNINISNVRLVTAPKDLVMNMNVFRVGANNARMGIMADETVSYTTSINTVHTPIYDYSFISNNDGTYTLSREAETASIANFNPTVFRGQASATSVLSHEMSLTNMVFDHVYLDTRGCEACNYRDVYSYRKNNVWLKPFYITETLTGNHNGGDIDSDFYGTIAGFDFRPVNLSSKWKFLPTIYGAYTNSKTDDIEQSGVRFGAMGTLTNGRFGTTLMLYGGMHNSKMLLDGITDSSSMTFAGGVVKTAYDINAGKFIIQPNFIIGYKVIGDQKWNTDFGNIIMETDAFDGTNAAPGLSVIYKMNNWSAYALSRYMMQLGGCEIKSRADGVELPVADACHNYAEFGLGAATNLSRGLSGFVQATGTAVGRTGVGGKIGLNWKF